ncbi:bifunctional folylpolyglutamate synthase/dihydrofolate synthase [Paenibacillus sp. 598K]|uniref:bifunctional folylpolyglutamate synthase/dihydrofolate synthase n=1 Tax=Paenibacillus sp. 598K TaxID=1117987 RepID=UPI000FFA026E|nr:folylpolyglutamate synthase/dihydrofolate synthase family protein [Paenibacillus sp. 598K]GBF73924.1 bifunctional folylpolyglutamate synthase/dihydrofolate synthase [Paenibacillus sp. 598K]
MSDNQAVETAFTTYEEARDWIESLVPFGIRPGLDRIRLLLERFDHPERRLKFIHVAGTNGKGSVCAYLTRVLVKAGYDVGTYTSPYITSFTNRIQYNGTDMDPEALVELVNEVRPQVEEIAASELGSPTMFEVSTLLAILYYARRTYPDFVVWETGLGGRLDVTNVVSPLLSVITNVGHDHMDILGDSLEAIAREKAGIIKPGVPVVASVTQPEAIAVLREQAAAAKSTLYLLGEQYHERLLSQRENEQVFEFDGLQRSLGSLAITMNGRHQVTNAAVAVMALEVLRSYYAVLVDEDVLRSGLRETVWAGRLEMVSQEPRLLLDGAHNPEGAAALAAALQDTYSYKRLHVMLGMLENKSHRATLRHILPLVDSLIVTEPEFRKKMSADALAALVAEEGCACEIIIEPDWRQALDQLQARTGPEDLAVVTGTLYLIADVRSRLLDHSDYEKGW